MAVAGNARRLGTDLKGLVAKRFVRRIDGYSTAGISNVQHPELDAITDAKVFEDALSFALREGVRNVRG